MICGICKKRDNEKLMKDGSFVTHVSCGFTWFVFSSTESPEVTGAAAHVAIYELNCDKTV